MDTTLVRYGELALKSAVVRNRFEDILIHNIKTGLKSAGFECKIRKDFGRIFIDGYDKKIDPVLKRIFGIVSFSPCLKIETDLERMKKESLKLAKKFEKKETFVVRCNRVGKHSFGSQDIERLVGEEVFEKLKLKVNLTKPDNTIGIEIRNDDAYLFTETVYCQGGLPLGTAGKVACLIENFDGIIAAWLFMKRGCLVTPVLTKKYFERHLKVLESWHIGHKFKLYLKGNIDEIVRKERCEAIVTGETIQNFKVKEFETVGNRLKTYFVPYLPVFRPLVGFDKKELRKLKQIIEGN